MQITWAYIAGFTDGEGWLGVQWRCPRCVLAQKTREVLDVWLVFHARSVKRGTVARIVPS